jgi:hypothetical protein
MALEIKGTLTAKLPIQSGPSKNGKTWAKQDFLIETPGEYPKTVCITSWKPEVLEQFEPGDELTVSLELSSREYQGKYFSEIRAWKIAGEAKNKPAQTSKAPEPVKETDAFDDVAAEETDLPF